MTRTLPVLFVLLNLLTGCVSGSGKTGSETESFRIGLVTSGMEKLSLSPGTLFGWKEPLQILGLHDNQDAAAMLTREITENLEAKGFRVGYLPQARYRIHAVAILGDPKRFSDRYPDPGLLSQAGELQRGSLVIEILSSQNQLLWHGTAQIFTDDALDREERLKRAQLAVEQLLREITPDLSPTACKEPRPQICTMVYDPVCATLSDGQRKEYPSGCSACADPQVSQYLPGQCRS